MVRDPEFNGRLENEWHALDGLRRLGLTMAPAAVPLRGITPGWGGSGDVIGETVSRGGCWSAGDPALRAGVEGLTELGRRTATMRAPAARSRRRWSSCSLSSGDLPADRRKCSSDRADRCCSRLDVGGFSPPRGPFFRGGGSFSMATPAT